jgi:phage terminase large subunit-like protein
MIALHSTLQEYIDGVLSGQIVACKLVRATVERHVSDLKRQSTAEFPYHFDAARAAKACRFYPQVLRHSIGRMAGMPFELEPWQVFCESMLFGWLRDSDGTRRFRRSYESVGRKNGKSTRIAGRAIYMARFDNNPVAAAKLGKDYLPEPVAQCILAATKREQAVKVIYSEVERMRRQSPSVMKGSKDSNKQLLFFQNDGEIITVGSDKPYDGLNPHFVAMDEIHAWREHHREFHDTMITGSGFRDQPLISYVTTAGNDKSYLWLEIYNYAKSVVEGRVDDPSFFAFAAELDEDDDPLDEANWIKANPNLGVSVSLDYLREQARQAAESKIALNRFTRYHGNRIVTSTENAFDLEDWDACESTLSDWSTADAVGAGVDLGGRDDLASYALVARWKIGEDQDDEGESVPVYRYETRVRAYLTADSKRFDKQPFGGWAHDGLLIKSTRPIHDLQQDLIEDCQQYGVSTLAYDPYSAQQFAEQCESKGLTPARMAQNQTMFNEPIEDLTQCIRGKRFAHDGNPLLRWCVGNAVLSTNATGRSMYDKKSSGEKIDPVVAMTMAFRICALAKPRWTGALYL